MGAGTRGVPPTESEGQLGGARLRTSVNWRMLAFSSGMHLLLAVPPSLIVCVAATQESSEAQEAR